MIRCLCYDLLCQYCFYVIAGSQLCLFLPLCSLIKKFYSELDTRYVQSHESHMTWSHNSHMTWSHAYQVTWLVQCTLLYLRKQWLCLLPMLQEASGCVWSVQTPSNKTVCIPVSGHPPRWPSVWRGFTAYHNTLARWLRMGGAVKGGWGIHMVCICERTDSVW